MTDRKKERRGRFGGMESVLAQHRLLDAALGPGEGAVDVAGVDGPEIPSAPLADTPSEVPLVEVPTVTISEPRPANAIPKLSKRNAAVAVETRDDAAFTPAAAVLPGPIGERVIAEIRASPFQPQGRPSRAALDAVRRAVAEAGSLDALVSTEGAVVFARLDTEAARLAELAFDIAVHGVKDPVVTRIAEDGMEECLSGHRRIAAARFAGLTRVPVLSRGPMSNANAAATVLSGNLHREPFTTWQEAVLVSEVRERRLAEHMPADVRTLSRVMGWASGKAQARLKLRRTLSDALLAELGDSAFVEQIGRVGTKELNRIADAPDEARRLALLRRALGIADPAGRPVASVERVVLQRPRRGGGFVLEVRQEIEQMPLGDLAVVRELLEAQLGRVTTRMGALRRSS